MKNKKIIFMSYFNYHATAKKLITDGKLIDFFFCNNHNGICPALVLKFNDQKHPVMPIRKKHWNEYLTLIYEHNPKNKFFEDKI